MRNLLCAFFVLAFASMSHASDGSQEKPIKHLTVPTVDSLAEAQKIFIEKTFEINSKRKLDEKELHQIHIITYTLEQSIAYFNANLTGESKELTKTIADVVENIHLSSENNRKAETEKHLKKYFELARTFLYKHWQINKNT